MGVSSILPLALGMKAACFFAVSIVDTFVFPLIASVKELYVWKCALC